MHKGHSPFPAVDTFVISQAPFCEGHKYSVKHVRQRYPHILRREHALASEVIEEKSTRFSPHFLTPLPPPPSNISDSVAKDEHLNGGIRAPGAAVLALALGASASGSVKFLASLNLSFQR